MFRLLTMADAAFGAQGSFMLDSLNDKKTLQFCPQPRNRRLEAGHRQGSGRRTASFCPANSIPTTATLSFEREFGASPVSSISSRGSWPTRTAALFPRSQSVATAIFPSREFLK